jgi:RNA-directed DNA polymerase
VTVIEHVQQLATDWLAGMGLALKPSKTRSTHTLHASNDQGGFDFLGFRVRQFPVGRPHAATNRYGHVLNFKTIITPSPSAQQRHLHNLRDVIRRHRQTPQVDLIDILNRKIVGWARYSSTQVSKVTFGRLDHLPYLKVKRWAERRHPTKSHPWVRSHYWHTRGLRHWVVGPKDGKALALHSETPMRRHTTVKGTASLSDGDMLYWATRLGRHPDLPASKATLLQRQPGRCAWCGLVFLVPAELIEVDHVLPLALGGKGDGTNRHLLHRHCHDEKTAQDGSNRRKAVGGTHDKGQDNSCRGAG